MGVDEPPSANPFKQQGGAFQGKSALDLGDPLHAALRKAEAGVEQHAAVVGERFLPCDKIMLGLKRDSGRMRVKRLSVAASRSICDGFSQPSAQGRFERLILLEPAHDHQPIHDRPVAGDRETRCRNRQWNNAQIDIRGEPPVQPIFRAAGALAPVQG